MDLYLIVTFFLFGLIIGSFLNVVICRMNTARSLGGRSACMSCQNQLCWYELVPLFSFMGLKGRCRVCKSKISLQYPLVELVSGIIFVSVFYKLQNIFFIDIFTFSVTYLYYVVMFGILLVIVVYDIKHKIIPDNLSLMFGSLAFIGMFFIDCNSLSSFYFHTPSILQLLSGVFVALPFFLLWLVSRGAWMGLGDAKLALGLGWFLGLSVALSALALSFWIGTVIGLGLIFFKGYRMKSEIPFAPYLALGTFLAFIFQLNIFQIYF